MLKQHALKMLAIMSTVIALTICTADSTSAQQKEGETAKPAAKKTEGPKAPAKRKVRLPNHYGKLNLTDAQREKIYQIQKDYKAQIDSLKKQLAEIDAKKDAECEEVLSASQKSILEEILAQIQKKRAAKKKN